jgi:DNA-binding PadR family transcriptional regulator
MKTKELLKGNTEMIILASLADGPKHGYLITQWIRSQSQESFAFSPGMLYPLLHKLEQEELISASWVTSKEGRDKKIYQLTTSGGKAYRAYKKEWMFFAQKIQHLIS